MVQCRAESAPFALQVGWSGEAELQGWLPKERHQFLCRASSQVLSGEG